MTNRPYIIIITDLDGTLIDHDTYQYDKALPALNCIRDLSIPLILNSSKTAAEIQSLRKQLNNSDPYIVENGSGIYLPINNKDSEKKIIKLGQDRQTILDVLSYIRTEFSLPFTGFNDMSPEDIMLDTGLDLTQAKQALNRDFSEPIKWHGNDEQWCIFIRELSRAGLIAVKGGRYFTVTGKVNKADAIDWLRSNFMQRHKELIVIALGDSENDRSMLENADYSVLVRSPAHDLPDISTDNLIITEKIGPEGWNESIISLLLKFGSIKTEKHG